uniref:Uncharacterized protein n=1 Tax=Coccolithus braarudii TaxID=221442 RepID=A0A7S0L2F9_9EUKA|mmetsp:Transcript_15991/g.34727  ORF Transcript_15991/g.34727 Transcript_15991/m.34727 type:complete len:201 (+) Transcript_15991:66-668(+)|eukprot:CAMPEP_0183350534 /NCGR_PEP_ID=MMETSP0164_2-20130417/20010_1 /TAXON_ID=221442 /ORGANISM="Coccolithus pelagicus ssp braarudi, Strain PLY182g" /LENGTH=200 /DNA_ID=CAMNT_0025522485 /DNA_START=42 /DNA_END=644 /DNA_ORIENTATION=+
MPGKCNICGKVLRSGSDDAIRAHQRESESCRAKIGDSKESQDIKALEARVTRLIEDGRRLGTVGCSFEESERNARERKEAEDALKAARRHSKAEKKEVKKLARDSMSAANWTQALLKGDERFTKADDSIETRLAQHTVGLQTSASFRLKREEVEGEVVAKRAREEESARQTALAAEMKKKARKIKHEKMQRSMLSFDEYA